MGSLKMYDITFGLCTEGVHKTKVNFLLRFEFYFQDTSLCVYKYSKIRKKEKEIKPTYFWD